GAATRSASFGRALLHNLRRVFLLRRAIRAARAEVVISFLSATNVLTLLATRRLGIPVIVSERGDPDRTLLPRTWRHARALTYPLADCVVAQTEYALARLGRAVRHRGTVIANPVSTYGHRPDADGHEISGVGHLMPVKGFDVLIEAFAQTVKAHPDWRLVLWGEGPDRASLLALAERQDVADRVSCPGRSEAPGSWLASTTIFVLSSRHEGLPNALIEAMAAGTPVIATDCPVGGPRSVVAEGLDGLLVPPDDVGAMAAALERMMASRAFRDRLGGAAVKSADRFAEPAIMAQWTGLVTQAVAARRTRRRR
ncbi:MAG: glycosyltransferase, partial [Geminicoccaceae bacterium]